MDVIKLIQNNVQAAVKALFDIDIKAEEVFVEHPNNETWGDYATNVAMRLAPQIKQTPAEIAKELSYEMLGYSLDFDVADGKYAIFEKIDSASNGFLNFKLSEEWLYYLLSNITDPETSYGTSAKYRGKKILIEYTDPNPFKVFHIGHLMSNCIGESLSRILAFVGGDVKRANYQGDVGLHVAKAIWGMQSKLEEKSLSVKDLEAKSLKERVDFLGKSYALGARAYKEDSVAREAMKNINYLVFISAQEYLEEAEGWVPQVDYKKYLKNVEGMDIKQIRSLYKMGRSWSLEAFEDIYKRLGTKFDFYYFESLVGELGFKMVKEYLEQGIFEKNEGAVIFKGDKYGLHTRVFINSLGLPTYEAKDLGLAKKKYEDYQYDLSFMVTADEIEDYFKVVLKALELIDPDLASKIQHISHGMMKLKSGKMSSRTGNIITGKSLIDDVAQSIDERMEAAEVFTDSEERKATADKIAVGALKYGVLKSNIGRDIVFDRKQALSVTGDTGPYLQYAYVRAKSVLEKGGYQEDREQFLNDIGFFEGCEEEDYLLRWLYRFSESIEKAAVELSPNILCAYLFELAQRFNTFYAQVSILNTEDEKVKNFRLLLTKAVAKVLKDGLDLLGIEIVEKM